jgi:heme/copper-type cytochrome/quinol oxidase subunit 3
MPPRPRAPAIPNAVLGTVIFIGTEIMLFSGFISAHTISRSLYPVWPPPNQPRLPIEATAFNTAVLIASAVLMYFAGRRHAEGKSAGLFTGGIALGVWFLLAQGYEWAGLLREGLTLSSSTHGAFFYLIVGTHALHVMSALGVLLGLGRRQLQGRLSADAFQAGRIFWYFVVGLWPILYWRVYL